MFNPDTEFIFPPRVIPALRELRGPAWQSLVEQVLVLSDTAVSDGQVVFSHDVVARMAFILLMIRVGGCLTCQLDSYRGMRGCTQCASQTINRYRGSDDDLLRLYREAYQEVEQYLTKINARA